MFRNFIVTTIRIAYRQRLTTLLNIIGIALGVAVSTILIMHIRWELSYDNHIPNADKIFRVTSENFGDNAFHWAATSTPLNAEMKDFFPEIEVAVRMRPSWRKFSYENENGEISKHSELGACVDSTVFDVFGIKFILGSKTDFYSDVHAIVLTQSLAQKFFGKNNAIGKQLTANDGITVFTVKGVIPDCPENTHWKYNFLIPFKIFRDEVVNNWGSGKELFYSKGWAGVFNYIRINEKVENRKIQDRMSDFTVHFCREWETSSEIILKEGVYRLQPLREIHFSNLEGELAINGNLTYVWVFIISTIFILIVVSVNYINIATSLALKRLKEVGIKKITGSTQWQLVLQLMGESMATSAVGGLFSILIIDLILPSYNELASQHFTLSNIFHSSNCCFFIAIIIGLGIISGIYPALFITRYKPIDAIKGLRDPSSQSNKFRKTLLIIQFAVSIFMIFSTIGIYKQIRFFQNKQLGYNKENLVYVDISGETSKEFYSNKMPMKQELLKLPAVVNASYSSNLPGDALSVEGLDLSNKSPDSPNPSLRFIRVDKDYIATLGLKLVEGIGFTDDFPQTSRFILSKKAVEVLKLENPIGKKGESLFGGKGEIKGVIDDYHFASLHQAIEPIVLEYNMSDKLYSWTTSNLILRIAPGNNKEILSLIEKKIKEIEPDATISFTFIDDYLNTKYVTESKMSNLFKGFTVFTIIIACLGLFGITGYNAELKTKEIGIRRVLGASKGSIIKHLSVNFIGFIVISILIGMPLAYIYITKWMNSFAYHTEISIFNWVITISLTILVTYATILFHALRVANKKPVDVLKYE